MAARSPKIDCFYVYPTVSNAPGAIAPAVIADEEARAVRQQFARFAAVCRLYAPVYRQATLTALKQKIAGKAVADSDATKAEQTALADITAAWNDYLTYDNHGRGVVLIGHSQGAGILTRLIQRSIDGQPTQRLLVSAILPGTSIFVPAGRNAGGTFKLIPACRDARQTGCVISFNTFRADRPSPAAYVGPYPPGEVPLCTNPAALAGGSGMLKPFFSTSNETIIPDFTASAKPWTDPPQVIDTPFVGMPDLFSARCESNEHGVYLAVRVTPHRHDVRTGEIPGEWVVGGKIWSDWGLHLVDLNLTMGNLIDILRRQTRSYESHAGTAL